MRPQFDYNGFIYPPKIFELNWQEVQSLFVESFENSTIRSKLLSNFETFIIQIQKNIATDFKIWINGSFISKKDFPNDIDALFLFDYKTCEAKKSLLDYKYFTKEIKYSHNLDLYYTTEYPKNHSRYFLSHLNHLYWKDIYGHTRKDLNGFQQEKGFIEIKIDSSWKS